MSIAGLRAAIALSLYTVYALVLVGLYIPARRFGFDRFADWLHLRFHRGMLATLGIRVTVKGIVARDRPLLLASNHSSWVDIFILSSLMPLSFIAKSEVAGWPVAGFLARLQRSVFIDRQRRSSVVAKTEEIAGRLDAGDVMVLFAEGTTSDGNGVLPFRSALFGATQTALGRDRPVTVQPVAIVYTLLEAIPLGHEGRPLLSWIGDEELLPHLRRLITAGTFDVSVVFGVPVAFDDATDRKQLAATVETAVRKLHNEELLQRG